MLVERSQGLLSMNAIRVVEVLPQLNLALADQGVKPCGSAREGAAVPPVALPINKRITIGKILRPSFCDQNTIAQTQV